MDTANPQAQVIEKTTKMGFGCLNAVIVRKKRKIISWDENNENLAEISNGKDHAKKRKNRLQIKTGKIVPGHMKTGGKIPSFTLSQNENKERFPPHIQNKSH